MNAHAIEKTELNKILSGVSTFAVLNGSKTRLQNTQPTPILAEAKKRLAVTEECVALLFMHGVSQVEHFPAFEDELGRAKKGSTLTCGELLKAENLLRSTRIAHTSILAVTDENITLMREQANRLYFDGNLEEDIRTKILNDSEVSDYASDKLYTLRKEIRLLNERIRTRLSAYLSGDEGKYLQEGIVTMRDNRYVLPVRAEYKRNIKGFIHDRSASGQTFFIEPEEVLEMNNELRSLAVDEKEEVERILGELSRRVGFLADELTVDIEILEEIDCAYARAQYAYKTRSVMPDMNDKGEIAVQEGRHPLIDKNTVVPVSFALGKNYRFLLISGPNTGGKTVTLKMVGLFCLMAMCGLFIPAKSAKVSVFKEIYCDVGDAQSIEESLSTFSSHITNIIRIVENTNERSLVLIDELGGGTDPDEGQALAKAIIKYLLSTGCKGVVTTHYTSLKEFAFSVDGIENACMEFDSNTLRPLYNIRIGIPGASNALAISRRLGLKESILDDALAGLSAGAQAFEHIVRSAEESRILAEQSLRETNAIKAEWQEKLRAVNDEQARLKKERERLTASAKAEARRIIHDKTAEAEEILAEIEGIFAQESLSQADLIKARTLKNRLNDTAYFSEAEEMQVEYQPLQDKDVKEGKTVYVKSMASEGVIQNVRFAKKEAEVLCGNMRLRCKFCDLAVVIPRSVAQTKAKKPPKREEKIEVRKSLVVKPAPALEINVIGKTVLDALPDVEAFLDSAVIAGLEEVRIVHGVGTGKLRAGIQEFLRKNPHVAEFRYGKYGEGETGVTIVKIK